MACTVVRNHRPFILLTFTVMQVYVTALVPEHRGHLISEYNKVKFSMQLLFQLGYYLNCLGVFLTRLNISVNNVVGPVESCHHTAMLFA